MERWARVHFHVVRINRWSLALILMAALVLLLLPARGMLPVVGPVLQDKTVRQGVMLEGRGVRRDFSGKTEAEARAMLAEMEPTLKASPVPAAEEERNNGVSYVVPELNGYTLDVETTLFRLSTAAEGSRVEPATRIQTPNRKLSDFPQGVIRHGNTEKKAVAILVNVDWGEDVLPAMLATLKQRGIKVTFFVSGRWAEKFKDLTRSIARDGHEIATHGYDLSSGPTDLVRAGRLRDDIAKSVAAIEQITGTKVRYYAPHMSEVNPEILRTAAELRLRTVLYSLDTVDWQPTTSADKIVDTFRKAKAGDLVLIHPKPNTARALEKSLQDLLARGLQPLTLSEVINPEPEPASHAGHTEHH